MRPGDVRIIEVNNLTGGDHNFHVHGFFFRHIETAFLDMGALEPSIVVPAERLAWQDTIKLSPRPGAFIRSQTVTRLAVRFDDTGREGLVFAAGKVPRDDTSGGWVLHCHILEHADGGMMSFVQVVE